jgi:hypothetical protein
MLSIIAADRQPARLGFGNSWSKPRPRTFRKRSSSLSDYPIAFRISSIQKTPASYTTSPTFFVLVRCLWRENKYNCSAPSYLWLSYLGVKRVKRMSESPGRTNYSSGQQVAAQPQRSAISSLEQDQSLSVLFDVSRELTSILGRDELLQRIADRVKKLVNYHLFMVMLWNEGSGRLECAFAKHYEEEMTVQLSVPLFKGITGHVAGNRLPVRVEDVRLDQRYVEFPHSDNVRSEMVIPLLLQDRLVGVLDLESTQLSAFTMENERMLGIVGSYIAVALENSRLYAAGQAERGGPGHRFCLCSRRSARRGLLRFSALWKRAPGHSSRRCLRQGHGSGTLWVAYRWNSSRIYARPQVLAGRDARSVERAAERGPHDSKLRCLVVCGLRRRSAPDDRGECRCSSTHTHARRKDSGGED